MNRYQQWKPTVFLVRCWEKRSQIKLGMELHGDLSSASVSWEWSPGQPTELKMEVETFFHFHTHCFCESLTSCSFPEEFHASHKLLLKETINTKITLEATEGKHPQEAVLMVSSFQNPL